MTKRLTILLRAALALALALCLAACSAPAPAAVQTPVPAESAVPAATEAPDPDRPTVLEANAENFGRLLRDLSEAYEDPDGPAAADLEEALEAIREVDAEDYELARSVADHWKSVYLDPGYSLYLHKGTDTAPELKDAGIPDSVRHAIVVLGYELMDGEMQDELKSRCEAAAAVARTFPNTILVCSGGATGDNNPEGHTEAGLMKDYLTGVCGIAADRIFTDENAMTTAENAVNTFRILQREGVTSMTIVTSAYHQRWGQVLYHLLDELYRREYGYSAEIIGNFNCDVEPSVALYRLDDRIAVSQVAGILGLPESVRRSLPSLRPQEP